MLQSSIDGLPISLTAYSNYQVAIQPLYEAPFLQGHGYDLFVRTISPSVNARIKVISPHPLLVSLDITHAKRLTNRKAIAIIGLSQGTGSISHCPSRRQIHNSQITRTHKILSRSLCSTASQFRDKLLGQPEQMQPIARARLEPVSRILSISKKQKKLQIFAKLEQTNKQTNKKTTLKTLINN